MESFIIPVVSIIAGIYFLTRNIALLRDRKKLATYVETSPRARLWVEKFGVERATQIIRTWLLPMGVAISAFLLGIGLWGLSMAAFG